MQQVEASAAPVRQLDFRVIGAFALIYFVWGSTFLAIRYALVSLPPFFLIGFRSTGAGALLFGWVLLKGGERLRWQDWRSAAVGGVLFFVFGHGSLSWAEQHVSSGLAAVVLALIPIWVVLLDWLRPGGTRPGWPILLGVAIGFAGLVAMVGLDSLSGGGTLDVFATVVLALSALAWATGTLYSRYHKLNASPAATSAMQLLIGGGLLLIIGTLSGEWPVLLAKPIAMQSIMALGYLIVVGSVITFSAYIWLLRVVSPASVATYAYVNPLVAVLLGWALAGERLTAQTLFGAAIVIAGVVIITSYQQRQGAKERGQGSEVRGNSPTL